MSHRKWHQRISLPSVFDRVGRTLLLIFSIITSLVIVFIFFNVWREAAPAIIILGPALLGPVWDPTVQGLYGILVFVSGTLWVAGLAIVIAIPLGLGGAIFMSEYSPHWLRQPLRMVSELMAGIPSIVYGLWAVNTLVPVLRESFSPVVPGYKGYGVLPGAIILAIMLLPTVLAVSDDALQMVPNSLREASAAMGASRTETALKVVFKTALPGIGAAVLLSLGRAIGETMAVLLVTGNSLQVPFSIFDQCYVMTSVLANQLGLAVGGYPLFKSALFVVGLVLLIISIIFTLIAKLVIRWGMRKQGLIR